MDKKVNIHEAKTRLSKAAHDFILDGKNEILLSAASTWEIAIKCSRSPEITGISRAIRCRADGKTSFPTLTGADQPCSTSVQFAGCPPRSL